MQHEVKRETQLLWKKTHVSREAMPPNRKDAELERLRLACEVTSVEAVPKAQEVTTRCPFLFVSCCNFEFVKLVVVLCSMIPQVWCAAIGKSSSNARLSANMEGAILRVYSSSIKPMYTPSCCGLTCST